MQLFGSGPILNEALRAQQILAEKYGVAGRCLERHQLQRTAPRSAARWSAGTACIPMSRSARRTSCSALKGAEGPIVAATDYMKVVADQIAPWLPGRMETLGTDGFGRSDNREYLRKHFEINAESIAAAALSRLARDGKFDAARKPARPSPSWASIPKSSIRRGRSTLPGAIMQTGQRVAAVGMAVSGAAGAD